MAEVKGKVFFQTQANRRAEEKVKTVAQKLAEINTKVLFKTLAKMVAVVKVETRADKLAIALTGKVAVVTFETLEDHLDNAKKRC